MNFLCKVVAMHPSSNAHTVISEVMSPLATVNQFSPQTVRPLQFMDRRNKFEE